MRWTWNSRRGSFTALVGESGCGKSTIAGILMGRNKHYAGQVLVGGVSLDQLSEQSLNQNITYISHQSYLFKGTVRENLLLAAPQAEESALWQVLEQVRLADFLRSGRDGYPRGRAGQQSFRRAAAASGTGSGAAA